jgi:hypothetical protein
LSFVEEETADSELEPMVKIWEDSDERRERSVEDENA